VKIFASVLLATTTQFFAMLSSRLSGTADIDHVQIVFVDDAV
jgi:hypothetical protein